MIETEKKQKLPAGWKWVKLGEVAVYINGRAFKPEEWVLDGLPIIRIQNLNNPDADFNYFKGEIDPRYVIENGDLLISWSASLDAFIWNRGSAVLNQHIFKVAENKEIIHRQYLYFAVREAMVEICKQIHGATMKHITKPEFEKIPIPLPPLPEQKRIAGILTKQMAAAEKARKACEEKLHVAQQLPDSYLYAVFNSPESKKWTVKKVEEICEITARQVDPKIPEYGNLPHVNGENIESGTRRLTFLKTAKELGMISGKYLFEKGDVLYSKLRPYLRKVFVADFKGVCSADMYPICVNKAIADPSFFAWLLLSDDFTRYANEESMRARMPKLNRKQLFEWKAKLPSLKEQRRLVEILEKQASRVETLCKKIESELETINRLPASLLQQAFKGKL